MTAAEFARLGVATVYEASGREGLIDVPLHQIVPGSRAAGPARIAACGQNDNQAVHRVMAHAQPGDVLVLAMPRPEPIALLGELLAVQAQRRGVAAVLVDAAVRDVEDLRTLGLPVWARYVRVAGADKAEPGEIDIPVRVGGAVIRPGDLVVLDTDGVVVVNAERAAEVLSASTAREEREKGLRLRFAAGELSRDIYGFTDPPAASEGHGS
jgi:4-hydroxy-4-methyl-2-oxoglutarate aldolase